MNILIVALFLLKSLRLTFASIAGVTYLDHFDFEERYRDINECNPIYWHPLHLPDDCVEMFEKAIRSGIKSNVPIRLLKERNPQNREMSSYDESSYNGKRTSYGAEVYEAPIISEVSYYGHPFGKMLELLSRDVRARPKAPTVGLMPNIGLVALYQQPISRRSEKMIKKIAGAYAPEVEYSRQPYFPPYVKTGCEKNNNCTARKQIEVIKGSKSRKMSRHSKFAKKKIKKNGTLSILTMNK